MSGGSFNYAFRWTEGFAEELEVKLDENRHKFDPLTLKKLKEIEVLAHYTAQLMREVEWLCSGDTSDESFMKRVADIQNEPLAHLSPDSLYGVLQRASRRDCPAPGVASGDSV